jgi:hypothetical protein
VRFLRFVAASAATVLVVACASDEPPVSTERVPVDVAYQHISSGMTFPPVVGGFERTTVYRGRAGSDGAVVGYAYLAPSGPMLVTVTVEASPPRAPAPDAIDPGCREGFAKRKADIGDSNANVKWLEEKETPLRLAGGLHPALMTSFDYDFRGEPQRGYLYVACHVGGAWTLQYRIIAPRDPRTAEVAAAFIAALPTAPTAALTPR